jgi:Flp pilus assembly protein TadD
VRAAVLWEVRNAPVFAMLMGDARSYDLWAQEIARGEWLGSTIFFQTPLYPYFLGVLYTLAGRDLLVVRLVQLVLGATSCVLLALAGRHFFGRRVGILAGGLLAVYPTAVFYDGSIQKPVLDIFLFTLLLFLLGRTRAVSRPARWLPVGATLGLLMLTRENALVFVFLLAAWLMLPLEGTPWRRRLASAALFAGGLALVLLPVALRNTVVGGEFRLTAAQFGPTLYMGNHPGADGTYIPLRWGRGSAAFEAVDARELAEAATGRRLRSGEVSAYWTGQALAYIRAAPGDWLRLMLRKWLLVWNVTEIGDTIDEYTYAEWSVLLRALHRVVHFGIVAPLAILGICLVWPDRRRNGLLLAMVAVYTASVALFVVMSRYRLPLVPILLLFVAAGLLQGLARLSRERSQAARALVLPVSAALAAAVIVNWPLVPVHAVRATTHTNIGIYLAKEGNAPERAVDHFERALALNPGYVEAHGNLGAVLGMRGETDQALAHLGDALRLKPDYVDGHYNAGLLLGRSGRAEEAIGHFAEVVRLRPDHADAHHALGFYLAAGGDLQGAKAHYVEALRLAPDHADAHLRLGILLLREGRPSDARLHLAHVVQSHPDSEVAQYHLGLALLQDGQFEPAAAHFRAALRGTDADGPIHARLGEALARLGRCFEAAPHLEEAARRQPIWAVSLSGLRREWGCPSGE